MSFLEAFAPLAGGAIVFGLIVGIPGAKSPP